MNFCTDCAYFRRGNRFSAAACTHPDLLAPPDPLDGYQQRADAREARGEDGGCGPEGGKFAPLKQPKPEAVKTPWWRA